jgi:hypothetical protein
MNPFETMLNETQNSTEKIPLVQPASVEGHPELSEENQKKNSIVTLFWWIPITIIGLLSLFFLFFGIETLSGAYSLKNPLEFIMFFFSASFVILLSSVGLIFTFVKIYGRYKLREKKDDEK